MHATYETRITRAIIAAFHEKLSRSVTADVLVVGAGPSGLVAAAHLAAAGRSVTVLEKRLAPGGGMWGGAMAMNEVVLEQEALAVLAGLPVRQHPAGGDLYVVDAVALASGLCMRALEAGAVILNLTMAEDLCIHDGRAVGAVANRTAVAESLPIDPITFSAAAVLDATGHEMALVNMLSRRGLLKGASRPPGEGAMNAAVSEAFVVERVTEIFPGLWVTGMSVAAALGGPRMGPIFGGMLLSGRRAAELIDRALGEEANPDQPTPRASSAAPH